MLFCGGCGERRCMGSYCLHHQGQICKLTDLYQQKNQLYLPVANLFCCREGVSYSSMKIFSSLPNNIKNLSFDRV